MSSEQPKPMARKVLAITIAIALALGVAAVFVLRGNGLATAEARQTGAIQVVLDQVYASSSNGSGAVTDILAKAGSSDDRYWLLATQGTIVYVKDYAETNAYRGLSVSGYPAGDELQRLFGSMGEGEVSHAVVSIGGSDFLASAVNFSFGGASYSLCLLTSMAFLDSTGAMPQVDVPLLIILVLALAAIVAAPTLLASRIDAMRTGASRAGEGVRPEEPTREGPESERPEKPASALAPEGPANEPERASQFESEPMSANGFAPAPEPEPAPALLPLRPANDLESHLHSLLAAGIPGGRLVKIACSDPSAKQRVLARMGGMAEDLPFCFELDSSSFVIELFEVDEETVRSVLAGYLKDDAEVASFLLIDEG